MLKNKYYALGVIILVLGGIGGYVWLRQTRPVRLTTASNSSPVSSSGITLSATSDPNSISLTQAPQDSAASTDNNSLKVTSDSGTGNLGQIDRTAGSPVSSAAPSTKTSTADLVDPTTFGQYDKYKPSTSSLFGELKTGDGAELTANKKATVYYKGWLTNGQLFDQSQADSNGQLQPFSFTMGAHQVIPGWEEALVGMKVGGTRLLIVPPAVGYGASGQGPIPGNAVLVFEVWLINAQ